MFVIERMVHGLCISCERPLSSREVTNWCSEACMLALPFPVDTDQLPMVWVEEEIDSCA